MQTIYTVKDYDITLENADDYFNIWFFGDVHRDTQSCDVDRWKWFLSKSAKDDPEKTYYIGLGDYHDFMSASEEKHAKSGKLHETTIEKFDMMVEQENRAFCQEIKQMRGKLIGLVDGNHNWTLSNGKTSTMDLAERMESEYLGWLSHLTIRVKLKNRGPSSAIHAVLCHGKAGGKTFGVTINQVGDLKSVFPIADIYCMGHDHQRGAWPVSVLYPTNGGGGTKLKQKRQFLCRSGSFKKSYTPDKSEYEAGRLLRPADLGALKLRIGMHRDKKEGDRMITDIEAFI